MKPNKRKRLFLHIVFLLQCGLAGFIFGTVVYLLWSHEWMRAANQLIFVFLCATSAYASRELYILERSREYAEEFMVSHGVDRIIIDTVHPQWNRVPIDKMN